MLKPFDASAFQNRVPPPEPHPSGLDSIHPFITFPFTMLHYPLLLSLLAQPLYATVLNTNKSVYINTPQVYVSSQLSNTFAPTANIAPYNSLLYNGYSYGNTLNPFNYNNNNTIYPPYYSPNQVPPPPSYLSFQQSLAYYNLTQVQLNLLISNPAIPKPPPTITPYTSQWVPIMPNTLPIPPSMPTPPTIPSSTIAPIATMAY